MDVNPLDRRRTKRVLSTTFICLAFSMCLSTMTRAAVRTMNCACAVDAEAETADRGEP